MNPADISIAPSSLVSIIIPCCGMLEYTKLCIPSVLRHSRPPYELIFLDVGSLDGTAEYLAGLRDGLAKNLRVEVCRAATDLDICAACKDALKKAHGDYVCLLNNDCVVVPKWLEKMITLAEMSPAYGLIGPMSNCRVALGVTSQGSHRSGRAQLRHPARPVRALHFPLCYPWGLR